MSDGTRPRDLRRDRTLRGSRGERRTVQQLSVHAVLRLSVERFRMFEPTGLGTFAARLLPRPLLDLLGSATWTPTCCLRVDTRVSAHDYGCVSSTLPTGVVTFLFTDVEGLTKLLHELGYAYADALHEHRRLLREAFTAHDGVEVDTQGTPSSSRSAAHRMRLTLRSLRRWGPRSRTSASMSARVAGDRSTCPP